MFSEFPINEIIHFDNETEIGLDGIIEIRQGNWFHLKTNEKEIIVNPNRVIFVEVFKKHDRPTTMGEKAPKRA